MNLKESKYSAFALVQEVMDTVATVRLRLPTRSLPMLHAVAVCSLPERVRAA